MAIKKKENEENSSAKNPSGKGKCSSGSKTAKSSSTGKKEPKEKVETVAKEPSLPKKKLCRIISFDKMSPEIKALFESRYPDGYSDFVTRYPKPNGDSFYAVSLYTEDADYLVKVDVDVDMSLDVDYDFNEPSPDDEVPGEGMDDEKAAPDVNDLADSLADEPSESL